MSANSVTVQKHEVALNTKINGLVLLFMGALFLVSIAAVFHPDLKSKIQRSFHPDSRYVLSTVTGDALGNGANVSVVKVKTPNGIAVEVYKGEDSLDLIQRIPLNTSRDAYFNLNGEAVNLALDDVDGDGHLEILVPTFDDDLIAHLSVYKFDRDSGKFKKMSY